MSCWYLSASFLKVVGVGLGVLVKSLWTRLCPLSYSQRMTVMK